MPDTERTKATILTTIFQDAQPVGSITPQDMRDFVVSVYNIGKVVNVEVAADLPAAVAGVRTLAANTCYLFMSDCDIGTDTLLITDGTTVLKGITDDLITLETTNTNPLITATSRLEVTSIKLKNDIGACIDFTGAVGQNITIRESVLESALADTFAGGSSFIVFNSQWAGGAAGLVISGAWTVGIIRTTTFRNLTGMPTLFTISSGTTFVQDFSYEGGAFVVGIGQTGLDVATNVLPTAGGRFINNTFTTTASGAISLEPAGAIDQTTVGWNFQGNFGVEDSAHTGAIEFSGNTAVTTINTQNIYETINIDSPGWIIDVSSERFILRLADSESLEHLGIKNMHSIVGYSASIEGASNNKVYEIRLLHNGVEVDSSIWDYRSNPVNVSHIKILVLAKNDYLTIQIRNTTDTTNVTVVSAEIVATKTG